MQTVATLGIFRLKSGVAEEKLTTRHSISSSVTESDTILTEMHCEGLVSDSVNVPFVGT